jgi:hypothetical protein
MQYQELRHSNTLKNCIFFLHFVVSDFEKNRPFSYNYRMATIEFIRAFINNFRREKLTQLEKQH